MRNDPEQYQSGRKARDNFSIALALANGHAACLAPFLRCRFGVRALGVDAVIGMLILFVYAEASHAPEIGGFFCIWFLAVWLQRRQANKLAKSGWTVHSRYTGYPWVAMKILRVRDELNAKGVADPVVCIIAGLLIQRVSPALGNFIFLGAFSFAFQVGIERRLMRMRRLGMQDAQIEQRMLARQIRGGGNGF